MPSYLRLWRRKQIVPGVRLNLSKSGVSLSLGPRGAHYTIGPRGTRATIGAPGTGLYYTTYSGHRARHAAEQHPSRVSSQSTTTPGAGANAGQREPVLPAVKIGWGIAVGVAGVVFLFSAWRLGLLLLVIAGVFLAVGFTQRNQPKWQIRSLIRKAHHHPQNADAFLAEALKLDPENAEALATSAERNFRGGNWPAAADLYERYLAKAPDDWQAEAHLGCSYLNAGDPDRAIPHLQKARAVSPLTEESQISLANAVSLAFLKKGDGGQALEILKTLPLQRHTFDGTLLESLFLRAVAHYQVHQTNNAVSDLDRLYALNPNYPDLQEAKDKMKSGTYALGAVHVSVGPS